MEIQRKKLKKTNDDSGSFTKPADQDADFNPSSVSRKAKKFRSAGSTTSSLKPKPAAKFAKRFGKPPSGISPGMTAAMLSTIVSQLSYNPADETTGGTCTVSSPLPQQGVLHTEELSAAEEQEDGAEPVAQFSSDSEESISLEYLPPDKSDPDAALAAWRSDNPGERDPTWMQLTSGDLPRAIRMFKLDMMNHSITIDMLKPYGFSLERLPSELQFKAVQESRNLFWTAKELHNERLRQVEPVVQLTTSLPTLTSLTGEAVKVFTEKLERDYKVGASVKIHQVIPMKVLRSLTTHWSPRR